MPSAGNKRVAQNAIALTLRMILVMAVGLYTSRVVLQALGVEDYGLYGVVGGVVSIVSFLNASMAGATSRFITIELGKGDEDKLQRTFSTALLIHLFIAIIVAILAETVGLWFLNTKMNFPPDRMGAVNVLYQLSIVSMFMGFTQVPYSAAIIAHEKMNIYAYFEIINVVLKLLIVYLLLVITSDRLIFYATAMLGVSVITAMVYRLYCIRYFNESKFIFIYDKSIICKMLVFSGFDMYGNMCVILRNQSHPIILNLFFGVVANAGAGIASTITGTIDALTTTIAQAFRPQIIKMYANNVITDMAQAMRRSVQFTLLAYAAISIPIFIEAENVIYLWLNQIPQYSAEFIRLIIITAFFNIVINTNNTAIHATGDIKNISFYNGSMCLLCPIVSFLILKYWIKDANIIYIINIVFSGIITILGWYFIKKQIREFDTCKYVISILRSWVSILITFLIFVLLKDYLLPSVDCESLLKSLFLIAAEVVLGSLVLSFFTVIIAFNRYEIEYLRNVLFNKIKI